MIVWTSRSFPKPTMEKIHGVTQGIVHHLIATFQVQQSV